MSTLNRSGTEILIDLINERYRTRFRVSDFEYGVPQIVEGRADGRNTQVTLTSTGSTLVEGPTTFYYNRLDLGRLLTGRRRVLTVADSRLTTESICEWFGAEFDIQITPDDLEPIDIDLGESDHLTVNIMARHTSIVFQGQADIEVRAEAMIEA